MPRTRQEIEKMIQELERKEEQYREWAMSIVQDVENKIVVALKKHPELMYGPEELFELLLGKKECSLRQTNEDESCEGCGGKEAPAPDHLFECDYCKHFNLFGAVLNKLAQEGAVVFYQLGNEFWVGINPNPPPLDVPDARYGGHLPHK